MSTIYIQSSAIINAKASDVYAILADYHKGHPAILPKPYFTELIVEKGGIGAGTIIKVSMNVFGTKRTYCMTVSEPEPGRILREVDEDTGTDTTFCVEPLNDKPNQTKVTITTKAKVSPGLSGFVERLINPPITRHIYKKELEQLAEYVSNSERLE